MITEAGFDIFPNREEEKKERFEMIRKPAREGATEWMLVAQHLKLKLKVGHLKRHDMCPAKIASAGACCLDV